MHVSVLLDEILTFLAPPNHQIKRMIDGTLGAAGHAAALLDHAPSAQLLAFDADPAAIQIASAALEPYADRVQIVNANYADMPTIAAEKGWAGHVDAILLDLGVSSMQLDTPERGFSFRFNAPLDMRFNPSDGSASAAELVNFMEADDLADIFYKFGEEHDSRRIARAIVKARPFQTTAELASAVERVNPRKQQDKIHPATRIFQALRIAVNDELAVLEKTLPAAIDLLKPGGRMAVISFHSLEDRMVKEAFRFASTDCICPPQVPICVCGHKASVTPLTKKPIIATDAEIERNPRSRSAKLRVVEKL